MTELPVGTVTFLFTDIEGSTQLLQQLGANRYGQVLSAQRAILRAAFEKHNGREIDTQGDAFFVSFPRATEAVAAAVKIQRALADHEWLEGVEVRVRMGLHTGEPLVAGEGYVGMDVHRAARIAHIGHGGQVLLSETTTALVRSDLPEGVRLMDLGAYKLKGIELPERIGQLVIEGFLSAFPDFKAKRVKSPVVMQKPSEILLPAFLADEGAEDTERPVFVAREIELERLGGFLHRAQAGHGGVAFITGEAGDGKTALLDEFANQSWASHPDLLAARGTCNALSGQGDPYRPFRQILRTLTGDVETQWAAGAITREQAHRLWRSVPETTGHLATHGQDLIDFLIPGKPLAARTAAAGGLPELLETLIVLISRPDELRPPLGQTDLFGQYAALLGGISINHPLLLSLDDLQWADEASLNLLFYLAEALARTRILIVGAYRREEVALGRAGGRHPLEKVLAELKRKIGDISVDLSVKAEEDDRRFVEALLDTEPNRLDADFRQALYRHTGGQPLFTVELLRNMQERGDLAWDPDGGWMRGPRLDWDVLPARVEGVIEERIGRLEEELRDILTVASVEGEDFTAQVVARVQEIKERGLLRRLNRDLDHQHQLIQERGSETVGKQRLYLYRFRHALFRQHLYNGLGTSERQLLHAEVGAILEELYGKAAEVIAPQLAWHFTEAGEGVRAVPYLLKAGDRARQLFAFREAIEFYERALGYQKESGQVEAASHTLMRLGLAYQTANDNRRARQAYEESFALRRQILTAPRADLPPAPHPLRLFWGEPVELDPGICDDATSDRYISELFSGLLSFGGAWTDWAIQPEVAHTWKISDDGRRYVFHLRDDVFWTDGQPVTAHDFEFAWKRVLDPQTGALAPEMIYVILGARAFHRGDTADPETVAVRAVAPYTLEVELEEPAGYFLNLLANTHMAPVPRHMVERYGKAWTEPDHLVTNGPFCLQDWKPGERIMLIRNPAYFGRYQGNLEQVEFNLQYIAAPVDQLTAYRAGHVDMLKLTPEIFHVRQQHVVEYHQSAVPRTKFLGFGQTESPFYDRRVRQALGLAIDRDYLAAQVSSGQDIPATGGFLPPGFPGHSPEIGLPFNPERARKLLAEAGYPDGKGFPQEDLLIAGLVQPGVAQTLQRFWDEHLGLHVNLKIMEWGDFMQHWRTSALFLLGWEPNYPDPDYFLRVGVRQLASFWRHPGYERLIQAATRSFDQAERLRLYGSADRILMEEAAIVPTVYQVDHHLFKPWLKNIAPNEVLMKNVIIEPR